MSRVMGNPNEIRVVNIRMVREPSLYSETPVSTPQDVMEVIAKEFSTYDREVFGVLNLKSNGQIINMNIWTGSFQISDTVKCRIIHLLPCAPERLSGAQRRGQNSNRKARHGRQIPGHTASGSLHHSRRNRRDVQLQGQWSDG